MSGIESNAGFGTKDGITGPGAVGGDHDMPYRPGARPRLTQPFPFHPKQYVRLGFLRSQIMDDAYGDDRISSSSMLVVENNRITGITDLALTEEINLPSLAIQKVEPPKVV